MSGYRFEPRSWLLSVVAEHEKTIDDEIQIPKINRCDCYLYENLQLDQKKIFYLIIEKIHSFVNCKNHCNYTQLFKTINGAGGSGKTVLINTIVTRLRLLFKDNNVVRTVAPTGASAFNVGGETIHHMLNRRVSKQPYVPYSLSVEKKKKLIAKFKSLLCLIIDERSLVSSIDLGICEQIIKETIYNGCGNKEKRWGGLPIVILVGDDYQLPSISEGAFNVLDGKGGNLMVQNGRRCFLECSNIVVNLTSLK